MNHALSPKKYFFLTFAITALLLAVVSGVGIWGVFFDESFGYQILYKHQLDKVASLRDVDTLLVGDSSLGNGIDAQVFSEKTGTHAMNLALTASYSYAGAYNMVKKTDGAPIKNIVVVCTLDTLIRPVSYSGYLLTMSGQSDLRDLSPKERPALVGAFYEMILSSGNFKATLKSLFGLNKHGFEIESDYIKQGKPMDPSKLKPLPKARIITDKVRFLVALRDYCKPRNIHLVVAHGPIYKGIGESSPDYIQEVNRILSETGIELVPDVLMIERDQLGDSADHVAPPFKTRFTERYAALLKPHLRGSSPTANKE